MAQIQILNDDSLMPFGKYKGEQMQDVPASYLLWLYDQPSLNTTSDLAVRAYVKDSWDFLQHEVSKKNKRNYVFNPYA